MSENTAQTKPKSTITVKVTVEREKMPCLMAGSRWEVVDSSLDSLWHGPYKITLRQVDDVSTGADSR